MADKLNAAFHYQMEKPTPRSNRRGTGKVKTM
jgi:hypothetical protein